MLMRMRKIINVVEITLNTIPIEQQFPVLYHGTSSKHIKSIISVGLSAPNHWGSLDIARYFAKMECNDEGGRPIIIKKPITEFFQSGFQIDENMIDFPVLPDIQGKDDEKMFAEWEASDQSWEDCLRIYESVIYNAFVAVSKNDIIR